VIKNSGQLTPEEFAQWEQEQQSAGGSKWEEYPEDADEDFDKEGGVEKALDAAKEIRESGNGLFRAGKYAEAAREYESTCLFLLIPLASPDIRAEAMRYLDVHPILPDDVSAETQDQYRVLTIATLLNGALSAVKITPPSGENGRRAVDMCSRVLRIEALNAADSGSSPPFIHPISN
jgi:peptidyl-prolyl isomerase D